MKKNYNIIFFFSILLLSCKNPTDSNMINSLTGLWILVKNTKNDSQASSGKLDTIKLGLLSEVKNKSCKEQSRDTSFYIPSSLDSAYLPMFIVFSVDTIITFLFPYSPSEGTLYSGCFSTDSGYYFVTNNNLRILKNTHEFSIETGNPLPSNIVITDTLDYNIQVSGDSLILTSILKGSNLLPASLWYVKYSGPIPPTN